MHQQAASVSHLCVKITDRKPKIQRNMLCGVVAPSRGHTRTPVQACLFVGAAVDGRGGCSEGMCYEFLHT